ncbi:putative Nodulation protein NolA [Deinococcus aerius]|uniref:Putative Nodulation protein NolA n=1 Tax=Deinococcus aerius TaxID=200253 RepID=A0A2I9D2L5_9DEIO|nr:MerR family transcriptional regulator [Deinococcus aerius]GBF04340.1 putative Nodulation protein NolA [Deinococcus aerius]
MRIGELARRANVSPRLLRYYEEQGVLAAGRSANGYRDYPESVVAHVLQLRGLLGAGLPISLIKEVLPGLDTPQAIHLKEVQPEMLARLELERDRVAARISCLRRNLEALDAYLEAVRPPGQAGDDASSGPPR